MERRRSVREGGTEDRPPGAGSARPCRAWAAAALVLLASAAACREPAPRETLEVLVPLLPSTLDPFADSRLVSQSLFAAVFEPLAQNTALGIRPALAESWTNPSPDTWVFRLASGAAFHDGSPVQSRDVVDAALGARSSRGSLSALADLRTIEVVDGRTVRFLTHSPAQDFLLAVSTLFIPRRHGDGFLGTGPFRVVARTPERVVLRRHDRPGRPVPLLEEVVFRRFTSSPAGVRLLRRRIPTAALDPTGTMVDEARGDPRFRVVTSESGSLTYLAVGLSADPGPLADVRVRRALRLALDLPRLVSAGTLAGGTPAGRLIPPGAFGYDPGLPPPARDLAEARRLLALAGHPDGFETFLDVTPSAQRAAEALARQAADAGIRLRVRPHSPDAFLETIDGKSPLYLFSWFVGEDPGQALRSFLHTKDAARGLGTLNRTGYSSGELDTALAALARTTEPEERLARLRAVSDLFDADLPWIPLYSARTTRIFPAWLDLPPRSDGLFVVSEARRTGGGR